MSGWEILIIIKHFGKQMDPKLRTFSRTRSHKVCTFLGPQWAKGFLQRHWRACKLDLRSWILSWEHGRET